MPAETGAALQTYYGCLLVYLGCTADAEIAARLYISPKTADHHVSAILAKFGLPTRRAVVAQAADLGLA